MKVTFITPQVGRRPSGKYIRTWQMEPLPIATLAGMTPSAIDLRYFDERVEPIDFSARTDLAAITVETYTAKRAYEIAAEYHRRGVPVVLGGYHPTLAPAEAERYADSIVIGYAEGIWDQVLHDAAHHRLAARYQRDPAEPLRFAMPRRDIFGSRPYFSLSCVETGRGCPARCGFCSVSAFSGARFIPRPVDQVVEDVRSTGARLIFFVDDNVVGNFAYAKQLFRALAPLKIKWLSQGTLNMTTDPELVDLMVDSGCIGLLIGLESLRRDTLRLMNKGINEPILEHYRDAIAELHARRIALYATFVFGYDTETLDDLFRTVEDAVEMRLFLAAFNHAVPFPGTPLYDILRAQGRLPREDWWLDPDFRFGDVPFTPVNFSAPELTAACLDARRRFYGLSSTFARLLNPANINSTRKAAAYFSLNWALLHEAIARRDLPLGHARHAPAPLHNGTPISI